MSALSAIGSGGPWFYTGWDSVNEHCSVSVPGGGLGALTRSRVYTVDPGRSAVGYGTAASPFNLDQLQFLVGLPWKLPGVTIIIKAGSYAFGSSLSGSSGAYLTVRASGTALQPLRILGETTTGTRADGSTGSVPATFFFGASPTDPAEPTGILIEDAEYVFLGNIGVLACGNGIEVVGAARYLRLGNLRVAWNALRGVWFSAASGSDGTDHGCTSSEVDGQYPACIIIERSELHDNGCGCHSAATQVMIGVCATNITVRCCDIFCSNELRGSDGITFAASSSGHIIERNRIHDIPRIRDTDCPTDCPGDGTGDVSDGDGIDMKGVWPRTAESGDFTIIRHNAIFRCGGTGITIQGGSRQVHVYGNEIFCVNMGVWIYAGSLQSQPENLAAQASGVDISRIYLYRNLIYCVERDGRGGNAIEIDLNVGVESHHDQLTAAEYYSVQLGEIVVAHNTVDRIAMSALAIGRVKDSKLPDPSVSFGMSSIQIENNLFARSRQSSDAGTGAEALRYVSISGNFASSHISAFSIDGNLYVLDPTELGSTAPRNADIIRLPGSLGWQSIWELWHGAVSTYGFEHSWMGRGDDPADQTSLAALNPFTDFAQVVDDGSYQLVADSPALGTAVPTVGLSHRADGSADISETLDFYEQTPAAGSNLFSEPDVGAVESDLTVPVENELTSKVVYLRPAGPPLRSAKVLGARLRATERLVVAGRA